MSKPQETSERYPLPKHTILIIDDSPANLAMMVNMLKKHALKILIATDGELGVQRAQYVQPDLILLDVMMPGIDGFETCRRLKDDERTKGIPLIFMTALASPEDVVKGFEAGGVDYLTKPLQYAEVLARVTTHLHIHKLHTDLQRSTEELRQTNQALQNSVETLQLAQDQLVQAEKMAALGHLVAGIAHEINTPIGIGVTAASHVGDKTREVREDYTGGMLTRSALEEYLNTVEESSAIILGNLNRAAEQIRTFKQVAVDQNSEEKRLFRVKAYISDLFLSLQPRLKRTRHTIRFTCPEELEIDSYPGAFSQIITNLIINSLQHGFEDKEQGEIVLDILEEEQSLILSYRDNGRGIDAQHLPHIFEPFYTTKRAEGGTGLGLHIVYNLVTQKLQGTIECRSTPGVGTAYTIRLPLSPA